MDISAEDLWKMPEAELLGLYHKARCLHAEKKFARDTDRARLQWLRAKAFVAGSGGVTERTNTVDASEDLARKGQQVREMTRELDLLKSDVDVIAMCLRIRGGTFSPRLEEPGQGEAPEEGD